ncbi:MAG: PAS domain-containing protein [Spirochaetes bacterium]|nr:PAS domain-containing protein [Spirochaetota bacterium]
MKIKRNTIFSYLIRNYFILIFLSIISALVFSYFAIKDIYLDALNEDAETDLILLNESLNENIIENYELLNLKIKDISLKIKKRITVIKKDGSVIADSEQDYKTMDNHINRKEIAEALIQNKAYSIRYSTTLKMDMIYTAAMFKINDIYYILRISRTVKNNEKMLNYFKKNIFITGLLLIIIMTFFVYYFSRKISVPVIKISELSKKASSGILDETIYFDKSLYEIMSLSENFNIMTASLNERINELKTEKEEINAIISSVKEGIMVVNNEGRIIRYNDSLIKLFNREDIDNKFYWEVIRDNELNDYIKNFKKNNKNKIKEIEYNNKILFCSMNHIEYNKTYIFIFYDATEIKNLEIIKKDFISNVSHELRTPLTAIRGYIETLMEEETDKSKIKYYKIIERHAKRLIFIINDLLSLSKLEEQKDQKMVIEEIKLKKFFKHLKILFQDSLSKKDLKLNIKLNIEIIKSDMFMLEQIFINLIDNAIKYTDKGKIKITADENADSYILKVKDTGIGIPEKDIDRIFERFYVADKSRSRKSVGSGLGLAIVKHNVLQLNGTIDVRSVPGEGSVFVMKFPK